MQSEGNAAKAADCFFMRVESISGPSWFLISLLEISVFFEMFRLLMLKFRMKSIEKILLVIFAVIIFPIGIYNDLPRCLDEPAILFSGIPWDL